jgi:hypothetical protein
LGGAALLSVPVILFFIQIVNLCYTHAILNVLNIEDGFPPTEHLSLLSGDLLIPKKLSENYIFEEETHISLICSVQKIRTRIGCKLKS